jgi:hypothetical protein
MERIMSVIVIHSRAHVQLDLLPGGFGAGLRAYHWMSGGSGCTSIWHIANDRARLRAVVAQLRGAGVPYRVFKMHGDSENPGLGFVDGGGYPCPLCLREHDQDTGMQPPERPEEEILASS